MGRNTRGHFADVVVVVSAVCGHPLQVTVHVDTSGSVGWERSLRPKGHRTPEDCRRTDGTLARAVAGSPAEVPESGRSVEPSRRRQLLEELAHSQKEEEEECSKKKAYHRDELGKYEAKAKKAHEGLT